MLSENELERFSRNFLISGWTLEIQNKIKNSSIFMDNYNETCARYLLASGIQNLSFSDINNSEKESLINFHSEAKILNINHKWQEEKFDIGIFLKTAPDVSYPCIFLDKNTLKTSDSSLQLELNSKFEIEKSSLGINAALLTIKLLHNTSKK